MADSETIKEFLVKLGYKVDQAGNKKFNEGIAQATKSVEALGVALDLSLAAVTAFTVKAGEALDKLYFASQRTGSAVEDLQAASYAVSQLGGSGDAAKASLENLGHFMRSYPGSEEFLAKLGVKPENLHNSAKAMEDLGRTFRSMPFWQAQPYANMLGIDEKTLIALQSGQYNKYLDDYNSRLKAVGLNESEAAKSGNDFMTALRGMSAEANIVGESLMNGPFGKALIWTVDKLAMVFRGVSIFANSPSAAAKDLLQEGKNLGLVQDYSAAPTGQGQNTAWNRAIAYFQSQGWSPAQAIGLAANLKQESGFNPAAVGDNGTAYGIGQWHKDRRAEFKKWAGHDIFGSSLNEQLAFMQRELASTEWNAGAQVHDAKDSRTAAERASKYYFRPADTLGEMRLRGDIAAGKTAQVTQTTNITVTGNDPNAVASAVAARQNDINNTLVRNVQGAVR